MITERTLYMASYRIASINEEVKRALGEIIREVRDPRVSNSFLTVTAVEVTPDLKYAKVFYSFLSPKYSEKDVENGLKSANGVIRAGLKRVKLRVLPELRFIRDHSPESGMHVGQLLKQIGGEETPE